MILFFPVKLNTGSLIIIPYVMQLWDPGDFSYFEILYLTNSVDSRFLRSCTMIYWDFLPDSACGFEILEIRIVNEIVYLNVPVDLRILEITILRSFTWQVIVNLRFLRSLTWHCLWIWDSWDSIHMITCDLLPDISCGIEIFEITILRSFTWQFLWIWDSWDNNLEIFYLIVPVNLRFLR